MTRLEKIWGYAMQVFYKTCDVVSFFSGVDRSHNIWAHSSYLTQMRWPTQLPRNVPSTDEPSLISR